MWFEHCSQQHLFLVDIVVPRGENPWFSLIISCLLVYFKFVLVLLFSWIFYIFITKLIFKKVTHFEERESAGMTMQFCRFFCMVSKHLQEHEGVFFFVNFFIAFEHPKQKKRPHVYQYINWSLVHTVLKINWEVVQYFPSSCCLAEIPLSMVNHNFATTSLEHAH
jgi:hypothetical protein